MYTVKTDSVITSIKQELVICELNFNFPLYFILIKPVLCEHISMYTCDVIRVWRYQRGNRNPYIEEEQTTQWPKEKVQKDKLSTKHTHKTEDRVTRTQLRTGAELRCSGRVGSSCSSSGACRVTLVTNPVISHEWGKDREVFTTSGTYPWSFV